jgi:hypothetical protein
MSEYNSQELSEFNKWLAESKISYNMSQGMITVDNDDDELIMILKWAKTNG